MKKKNFIALIMGTVGGLLFALGMCMCCTMVRTDKFFVAGIFHYPSAEWI